MERTIIARTYYRTSQGQPRNGEATHTNIESAIRAWKSDRAALPARGGGIAYIEVKGFTEPLKWIEGTNGGYSTWDTEIPFDIAPYCNDDEQIHLAWLRYLQTELPIA